MEFILQDFTNDKRLKPKFPPQNWIFEMKKHFDLNKSNSTLLGQRLALHIRRDFQSHEIQNRRGDVHDMGVLDLPVVPRVSWIVKNENPLLGVVARIQAGIIFKRVPSIIPQRADRPPVQISKINNQIRRNIFDLLINFFGLIHFGVNRFAGRIGAAPLRGQHRDEPRHLSATDGWRRPGTRRGHGAGGSR